MKYSKIIPGLNSDMLYTYLGKLPANLVLKAFESAFGSVQVLSYEKDVLSIIVKEYVQADKETQKKFCRSLDGCNVSPRVDMLRKTESEIRRKEKLLRVRCLLLSMFRKNDIAESIRKQHNL